jgi:hypothetical protein
MPWDSLRARLVRRGAKGLSGTEQRRLDVLPRNHVVGLLTVMFNAFPEQFEVIVPWRMAVGMSNKIVPEFSYEDQFFFRRKTLQFRDGI